MFVHAHYANSSENSYPSIHKQHSQPLNRPPLYTAGRTRIREDDEVVYPRTSPTENLTTDGTFPGSGNVRSFIYVL